MPNAQQAAEMQAKQKQEQEMREDLLTKMVAPDARERLRNIAIVKPEKARYTHPPTSKPTCTRPAPAHALASLARPRAPLHAHASPARHSRRRAGSAGAAA